MNQIVRCDWLPERARWCYFACSGLCAVSLKKNFPESHIINLLLPKCEVKMAGYWLHSFFLRVYGSVHKLAKKELDQYQAILTSHLVSNPYLWLSMLDFPLMLHVKLPVAKTIHPQSNKFDMGMAIQSLMKALQMI